MLVAGVPPSVVQYRPKRFVSGFGQDSSPYQGWPSAEIDALWDSLYYSKFCHALAFLQDSF